MKLWTWIYWLIYVGCIINIIYTIPTWIRWKWGYFSIDVIPPILIILILYMINQILWIRRLDRELQELKKEIEGGK